MLCTNSTPVKILDASIQTFDKDGENVQFGKLVYLDLETHRISDFTCDPLVVPKICELGDNAVVNAGQLVVRLSKFRGATRAKIVDLVG